MTLDTLTQSELDTLESASRQAHRLLYRLLCAADSVIALDLIPDLDGDREEVRRETVARLAQVAEEARVVVRAWAEGGRP